MCWVATQPIPTTPTPSDMAGSVARVARTGNDRVLSEPCSTNRGRVEHPAQTVLRPARGDQPRAVHQNHRVLAVEQRLQLANALGVDDGRPMDANEAIRIERRLHALHRLA